MFLEYVAGHLSLGAEQVLNELQDLGYKVAAGLFTAEEVGASHRRERLFILANSSNDYRRRRKCGQEETTWSVELGRRGFAKRGSRFGFPPGPDEDWKEVAPHLAPATEPGVCELVDGLATYRKRWLNLLGNGVVPLQAAYAYLSL